MTPYDRLKTLAKAHGLSINQLEQKLGLSRNTLYSWRNNTPSGANLLKVADYFEVSIDYILGRTKTNESEERFLAMFRQQTADMSNSDKEKYEAFLSEIMKTVKGVINSKKGNN